jgi:hypothetical protein
MARHQHTRAPRTTVAIVGDGETEQIYFNDIKRTDRPKDLDIYPDLPKKSGFAGVLDQAIKLKDTYDKVYALIDLDKIISDNQQHNYQNAKQQATNHGVIVLENNPCFEVWILLHFENTATHFQHCDSAADRIQHTHINDYEKTQKYLVRKGLYSSYKERIASHAIPHARLLEANRQGRSAYFPRAEIFRFFEWYMNR